MSVPLAELQRAFQHYLLDGDATALEGLVADAPVEPASARLAIYHESYRLRLVEALQADYSTLHACLGDDGFAALGVAYADAHPSAHPSIRWFGQRLEAFVRSTPPWSDSTLFGDLAALDWTISLAFDAADGPVLAEADLLGVEPQAWPTLGFTVHPSVRTVDLTWNVGPLRLAADADEQPGAPEQVTEPVRWLVWRQGREARFRSMTVDEAFALQGVREGADFSALCEGLTEWIDAEHVALHAAGMLRRWVVDGVLSTAEATRAD